MPFTTPKNLVPKLLVEILDFYKFKIANNECTDEDMASAFSLITENTTNLATGTFIAKFYEQSPSNVRNIASRWGVESVSRRHYDFNKFIKFTPRSWFNKYRQRAMATT